MSVCTDVLDAHQVFVLSASCGGLDELTGLRAFSRSLTLSGCCKVSSRVLPLLHHTGAAEERGCVGDPGSIMAALLGVCRPLARAPLSRESSRQACVGRTRLSCRTARRPARRKSPHSISDERHGV